MSRVPPTLRLVSRYRRFSSGGALHRLVALRRAYMRPHRATKWAKRTVLRHIWRDILRPAILALVAHDARDARRACRPRQHQRRLSRCVRACGRSVDLSYILFDCGFDRLNSPYCVGDLDSIRCRRIRRSAGANGGGGEHATREQTLRGAREAARTTQPDRHAGQIVHSAVCVCVGVYAD